MVESMRNIFPHTKKSNPSMSNNPTTKNSPLNSPMLPPSNSPEPDYNYSRGSWPVESQLAFDRLDGVCGQDFEDQARSYPAKRETSRRSKKSADDRLALSDGPPADEEQAFARGKSIRVDDLPSALRLDNDERDQKSAPPLEGSSSELVPASRPRNSKPSERSVSCLALLDPAVARGCTTRGGGRFDAHAAYAGDDAGGPEAGERRRRCATAARSLKLQIERPTEKSLDDDDDKVLAAFEIVLSGYKKAQKRTRAIAKAYSELESLAVRILDDLKSKDLNSKDLKSKDLKSKDLKSKEQRLGGSLPAENSSTPGRARRSEDAGRDNRTYREARPGGSIEMVDLTSLFAFGRGERGVEKPSSQPASDGPGERATGKEGGEKSCPVGDEENEPPPGLRESQEPRTSAKVGLAKVIYSVEDVRATPQRRSRQSTLVFKPVARRSELSRSLEKRSPEKGRRLWADNLFDEDYSARKKRESERATRIGETSGAAEPEAIPSDSQINETARSLFDDEDPDNFRTSPDILNTCAESSALEVAGVVEAAEGPRAPKNPADFADEPASVDETFFAPAELLEDASRGRPPVPLRRPGDENVDGVRGGKRKSPEEANDETGQLEGLALQDINWDAEMSDDDWNSSAERAPHDSFHLPPEKKKKSPQYAYKEGVERNKAKRSKLHGWNCWQCEQYYEKMQLPEEELRKRMDACSRHRGKFNPRYCTPKDFWNPVFPDSTDSSDCSQN